MKGLVALVTGLMFGAGLVLSGMTRPERVIGFLDVTGNWDPSLAFVMGGALLVAAPLFALARWRTAQMAGRPAPVDASGVAGKVDLRLVGGAALFGIGWGVAGICPGPALVDFMIDPVNAGIFLVPMIAGLLLSRRD